MKILQVHSKYKKRGGEETVVAEEKSVLEANGDEVIQYLKDNAETDRYSTLELIKLSLRQRKNNEAVTELKKLVKEEKPDICHVHNVYPLISPAIYKVCQELNVPVIQTLHNYKMLCTNSLFFREGEVCELCMNKSLVNSLKYRCYKNSLVATAVQADTIQYHRRKGTWQNQVDTYVCLTEFHRQKMIEGGLPEQKIVVKPNFTREIRKEIRYEDYFLFVGRLDESKGLADLLKLFRSCTESQFVLIGESDRPDELSQFANVKYLGPQSREVVLEHISQCKAVVFPSKYYEGMPMVILEAFSLQKAVIARNVGAMSSMIRNHENGVSYNDPQGLIDGVNMLEKQSELAQNLGQNAHQDYLNLYSVEQGYKNLKNLYQSVLEKKHGI
jgi:glycosyltransferase involved in cell wall biosynthesis